MIGNFNSEREEVLANIWTRVLQRTSVRPDDNFLAIGGDRAKAETIASEITSVYGREISPLLLLQAPTVSMLAGLLAQDQLPRIASILPLTVASQRPPIFLAHGIGDTVLSFVPLAASLESSHAIYGMQAPGVDGLAEPLNRIETMAQYHLEAIRRVQPQGPYFLVGYSMGGLIVLEIARRLSEGGEEIGSLVMLDSYPDRRYFSATQRIRWEWTQTNRRTVDMWKRVKLLPSLVATWTGRQSENRLPSAGSQSGAMKRTKNAQYEALRNYRPVYYSRKVTFVKAEIASYFPADPTPVWRRLLGELEIKILPGNHLEMLNANVDKLAAIVRCLLRESLEEEAALRSVS
jgi:thioesterase domain-containing protein